MKIKLSVSDDCYEEVESFFLNHGIETDEDSEFILIQKDKYPGHLSVKIPDTGEKLHISVDDIILIDSYGHTVEVCTENMIYHTADRLYQLIKILDPNQFIRVSNSVIISKSKVREISPTFSMKFILKMQNGIRVDVTRSYYNSFKEYFHI